MKITVIIPSLNPDGKLVQVVNGLIDKGFEDIVLVNDGSDKEHMKPFEEVGKYKQCHIVSHDVNRGKGRALKTAFQYCIDNRKDIDGVITVDGDNQHSAEDICACALKMIELKNQVILGARDFSGDNVPPKSKFGNNMTKFVFRVFCGLKISDTQTGLRVIPFEHLKLMTEIKGERFEYETNMLLEMKQSQIPYTEVGINTIYIEENASTHFHPIKDSIKIYGVILKFLMSSLLASVIDIVAFAVLSGVFCSLEPVLKIFIATVGARIISSMVNFTFNRGAVFKSSVSVKKSMMRYYILCAIQMMISFGLVWGVTELLTMGNVATVIAKIVIDTCLFIFSFKVQRAWVFK
ncbi:MAG: bifunctional glycosyltransferase family 2/GtrA family protein [Lachnospiraceae bacterium]|nr:bifunctional glycosyltransferase family 2/GtrA family protein [Lachnospiraceae bacterium]